MKLHLATDLQLPIEAVTEAIGFIGRRGSGKSYAAQKLAEEFHRAKAQFVALDPVGNWWGLRLAANGKDPGLPIPVFGGLQGDIFARSRRSRSRQPMGMRPRPRNQPGFLFMLQNLFTPP